MNHSWDMRLATVFGVGRLRPASGTWASAVALPVPVALGLLLPYWAFTLVMLAACAAVFHFGVRASTRAEAILGQKDPHDVVIDEVLGMWLTVAFIPFAPHLREVILYVLGFFTFRAFDIVKPFGIRRMQDLEGGLGVMIDDGAAGALSALCLFLLARLLDHSGLW